MQSKLHPKGVMLQWVYLVYFTAKFLPIPSPKMAYIFPILIIILPISEGNHCILPIKLKGNGYFPKWAIQSLC